MGIQILEFWESKEVTRSCTAYAFGVIADYAYIMPQVRLILAGEAAPMTFVTAIDFLIQTLEEPSGEILRRPMLTEPSW